MKRAKLLSATILCILCLSSTASFSTVKSQIEPIVSFTLWHTSSPVIQPPANREAHIPPIVEIITPQNQTVIQTSNFTLTIDVASYFWTIDSVYYQADWQNGIHELFGIQTNYVNSLNASIVATFQQIPLGNHTLTVYANTHDNSHTNTTVTFSTDRFIEKPTLSLSIGSFVSGLAITIILATLVLVVVVISVLVLRRDRKSFIKTNRTFKEKS